MKTITFKGKEYEENLKEIITRDLIENEILLERDENLSNEQVDRIQQQIDDLLIYSACETIYPIILKVYKEDEDPVNHFLGTIAKVMLCDATEDNLSRSDGGNYIVGLLAVILRNRLNFSGGNIYQKAEKCLREIEARYMAF